MSSAVDIDRLSPTPRTDGTALRLAVRRYTVDIVPAADGLLAVVGSGVGSEPDIEQIKPAEVVALLDLADAVDERTVWRTQAWPLAC